MGVKVVFIFEITRFGSKGLTVIKAMNTEYVLQIDHLISVVILSELKTLEWDILNPDRLINLEINYKRRTSIV